MSGISPKVVASTLVAALLTIGLWIAGSFGITVPVEVQGAITTILVFLAGYLKIDPKRV